jgi:hypothetical protein
MPLNSDLIMVENMASLSGAHRALAQSCAWCSMALLGIGVHK